MNNQRNEKSYSVQWVEAERELALRGVVCPPSHNARFPITEINDDLSIKKKGGVPLKFRPLPFAQPWTTLDQL